MKVLARRGATARHGHVRAEASAVQQMIDGVRYVGVMDQWQACGEALACEWYELARQLCSPLNSGLARFAGAQYDAVVASEVIEHVNDAPAFMAALSKLTRPGGVVAVSTLSRTPRSYVMAIIGAEYVIGLVPRGTHEWSRFINPGAPLLFKSPSIGLPTHGNIFLSTLGTLSPGCLTSLGPGGTRGMQPTHRPWGMPVVG